MAVSKCSYPNCTGYPVSILEPCQASNCQHKLHHLCQTATESIMNFDYGLSKRCNYCLVSEFKRQQSNTDGGGDTSSVANCRSHDESSNKTDSISDNSILSGRAGTKSMPPLGKGLDPIGEEQEEESANELNITPPPPPSMKKQSGYINNSIIVCPEIYLYNDIDKQVNVLEEFTEELGPFAYGKIVQVPNAKKNATDYVIRYDRDRSNIEFANGDKISENNLCASLPNLGSVKKLLKECVDRANKLEYRLNLNRNRRSNSNTLATKSSNTKSRSTRRNNTNIGEESGHLYDESLGTNGGNDGESTNQSIGGSSTLLSGILFETNPPTMNNTIAEKGANSNEGEDDGSISDDGSNYEIENDKEEDDDQIGRSDSNEDELVENNNEKDVNYLSDDWKWNQWKEIGDDESIKGPPVEDRYNGPHGLKPGFPTSFTTVLQCIFQSTAMSRSFFQRLASQSNKYARKEMATRHSMLFLGHKWKNITVPELIRFFGIMLRISLEPRKMGGYSSYFTENPVITIGDGYSIQLRGYDAWAKDIMSLVRFKQIRSAFHPESDKSLCNDKCHQLRYFIRLFNMKAKEVFALGANISFDEGGIAMRSRLCPIRMYNKDKPEKFRVDLFILADSQQYFIYHLDVYQGKNKSNIDIDQSISKLPTTQKAVANAIVKSGIANDTDGCRYIFLDNRYAAPQLLAMLSSNYNIRGVGTCRANRKGFASDSLNVPNNSERGKHVRLVDERIGMVITRWKDSKVLQVVSTIMKKGIGKVERRVGKDKVSVDCPNDIIEYQKHMGGVDRGDQHRVMGAGFANVAHFKKWYKKAFLGICDFSFLQAFTAWNLGVKATNSNDSSRRGRHLRRREMKKWEFYAVAAEEMMTYTDDTDEAVSVNYENNSVGAPVHKHTPVPFPKNHRTKIPTCMICSMEEGVMRNVKKNGSTNARAWSRRRKHLVMCSHPDCNIVCHSCSPNESKVRRLPIFSSSMSCFDIAHDDFCNGLFVEVKRYGETYTRSVKNHPLPKMISEVYENAMPRRSARGRPRNVITTTPSQPEAAVATPNDQGPPVREIQTRTSNSRQTTRIRDGASVDETTSVAESHVSNITTTPASVSSTRKRITRSTSKQKEKSQREKNGGASRKIITNRTRSNKKRKTT